MPISELKIKDAREEILDALARARKDVEEGSCDGILIVILDRGSDGNKYHTKMHTSNMRYSDIVALAQITSTRCVDHIFGRD
jgi:hypothetical protein